jgi:NAD(P)-dependent dehydrogenase (short-subunit alcohol dehydrogenase family)
VVNVSARVAASRPPRTAAYAAAKEAVAVVTEIVAKEVRDYNIWVNAVAPSVIDTEANRRSQPTADFSRWVSRRQVAEVILFLCSQRASGVRGAVVPVYGRLL